MEIGVDCTKQTLFVAGKAVVEKAQSRYRYPKGIRIIFEYL